MRYTFIIFNFLLVFLTSVASQTHDEILEFFEEAEYFFNRGDYTEAAYYYKKVLEQYPENANFNFKLGECYLKIPGEEVQAIPYLEKAIRKTVEKNRYKPKLFEEKNAPLHAFFYLGNAYRIDNQLDKALETYNTFINSPFYVGNYNEMIVENEMKACERAKIIQDSPVSLKEEILGDPVNSTASEIHPVISGDEKTIIFIRKLKFYDAIFLCHNTGNGWSQPVNLNPLVGSDGDFYPVCLSFDGKELYLIKTSSGGGDLFVSFNRDSTWTKAEKLGKTINTVADESSACLSEDGQQLYFTSARAGSKGGLDIYIAMRRSDGQWGKAKNAGKIINSSFDEDSPCLTNQGRTLYFSSKGHYSMGGFDLFYANKEGKKWSVPVNAGSPINTTADNNNVVVLQGGRVLYLSKINIAGNTNEDIYRLQVFSNFPIP
jgi:hypothetical protein